MRIHGAVAVVTGGASGIGLGMARSLLRRGARVALADIEPGPLDDAVAALRGSSDDVVGFVTDVADPDAVEELARSTTEVLGPPRIICNNAGVTLDGRLWDLDPAEFSWIVGVNVGGVHNGIRSFVPRLIDAGGGHVVNTASMAGLTCGLGYGAYAATKQAVVALSECLSLDLQHVGHAVGVSVFCPSLVRTRITSSGRNRPANLGEPRQLDPLLADLDERRRAGNDHAMDPNLAGELVADAIESNSFWVFSDVERALERIAGRFESIMNVENPTLSRGDLPQLAAPDDLDDAGVARA